MALSNTTTDQMGTKLSIVGGQFTLRATQETPGAVSRKLTKGKNEGKVVWELKYKSLCNVRLIAGIQVEGQYPGADIVLKDADTGDDYTVNFPLDSGYLYEFIKAIPNLNTAQPFNLEIHDREKNGKIRYHLRIAQNGALLKDHYVEWKKDANGQNIAIPLHGIPEPTKDHKGWNFREVENYLLDKFQDFFDAYEPTVPYHVETGSPLDADEAPQAEEQDQQSNTDEFDDQIPF